MTSQTLIQSLFAPKQVLPGPQHQCSTSGGGLAVLQGQPLLCIALEIEQQFFAASKIPDQLEPAVPDGEQAGPYTIAPVERVGSSRNALNDGAIV